MDTQRYSHVLLVARLGSAVVGQTFAPATSVLEPAEIWARLETALPVQLRRTLLRALVRRAIAPPEANAPPVSVSVVVCTRDRADDLRRCLDSLRGLNARPEVVVVDNASRDDAARRLADEFGVRYVREQTPGQSRARNAGVNAARGEYVAFTDDDCVAEPTWLDELAADFSDPRVGLVTGYIGPYELETPAQYMFEAHGGFERPPARRVYDATHLSAAVIANQVGAGANMIFRRRALEAIGGFAEDLGPGTAARSGDDKDAFYRVMLAGHRILYTPERLVRHRHRDTVQALRRISFDYGVSEFAYTLRNLARYRDLGVFSVWIWWLRHFVAESWSHLVRRRGRLPLRLLLAEIAGAMRAPLALRRTGRDRGSIPPIKIAPRPASAAPAKPRVSVAGEAAGGITMAVATRNRRSRLETLLRGLARQTLPDDRYEVVVVVDGSSDHSAEMARRLDTSFELRVVEQEASGLAVARNRGAREARHPVVVFFDDDIAPVDGLLAAHLGAHNGAKGPRAVLGPYPPSSSSPPEPWARRQAGWWNDHFRRKAEPGHLWTFIDYVDGNTSVQRNALEAVGGYDERLRAGRRQDWELGVRLLREGWDFVNCPAAHGDHHFDARFETAVRVGREEGRLDVALVRLHPEIRRHLPVAAIARYVLNRPAALERTRALAFARASAWTPALGALDRIRFVRAWNWLANRVLIRAYVRGMQDAIPDPAEFRAFLEWAKSEEGVSAPASLDLFDAGSLGFAGAIAPPEIEASWRRQSLGRYQILPASTNWGWEEVVASLADGIDEKLGDELPPTFLAEAIEVLRVRD